MRAVARRYVGFKPLGDSLPIVRIQTFMVVMIFLTSWYVKFEPAPTDLFFVLALVVSVAGGLKMPLAIMPLFLTLLIYNLAGLVCFILIRGDTLNANAYLIGLALTSVSCVFLACYIAEEPQQRFQKIILAYCVAATIGSVLGLLIYYEVQPFYSIFPHYNDRVLGGYKDPNVFSTWLVLPAVAMLQGFMLGTLRLRPVAILSFLVIFAALFLAFSRGAWIDAVGGALLMVFGTFILSPSNKLRGRILFSTLIGLALLGVALIILLSIPATLQVFLDRFTLVKPYDVGETGRFGNQLNALPMLQTLPFGFGPYQFEQIFGLAPHNTFLNAFASAGWLGGISYLTLVVSNFIVGIRTVLVRTPYQPHAIVVVSCLLPMTLQGIQIDTEHWRHLYWMTGITWGFFAASFAYQRKPARFSEIARAWNTRRPIREK
jgi:O-Antigen ligase